VSDAECVRFLQWALPHLKLRWPGFRKVRGQVCKRLSRRLSALGLSNLTDYRSYLAEHEDEWRLLDSFCRISISHFYRDREVFEYLRTHALPELANEAMARANEPVRAWCIGCAAGEEVYTLRILWDMALRIDFPNIAFTVLGTDVDPYQIERARMACYPQSTLAALPDDWTTAAFERESGTSCLRPDFRAGTEFLIQDIRHQAPDTIFDLIFCRNLAFTYFSEELQLRVANVIQSHLSKRGFLVLGTHEELARGLHDLRRVSKSLPIYQQILD
jgi:chemotaxis protein methyltransferase CheR